MSEELEVKNLQLNEVLKASNVDARAAGVIARSIEEIENGKNDLISDLQNQLQQIRRMHTHMVKAYEGKLAEFVIPVEELGFDPLVPTNVEWWYVVMIFILWKDWLWVDMGLLRPGWGVFRLMNKVNFIR